MRKVFILLAALVGSTLAPIEANATLQCVTYAREVTGLNLKGDAWKWWEAAEGVYDRGNAPKVGSVLVFKRQGKMSHGHVAVVRGTAGSRVLLVDHANWAPSRSAGRGKVAKAVPVMDVSAKNDWSEVRVWYQPNREYGSRVYKTQGFVYRPGASVMAASLRSEAPAKPAAVPVAPEKPAAEAKAPAVETKAHKTEIKAPAADLPVAAPVVEAKAAPAAEIKAAPAVDGNLGKFDAGAWAEHA